MSEPQSPPTVVGTHPDWYSRIRRITEALVRLRAVSPSAAELQVARAIHDHLVADKVMYHHCEIVPIPDDPWGRANVIAEVRGRSRATIILAGHFDTVGTEDYGALEPLATDPAALAGHAAALLDGAALIDADDWLFGRGAADMKSGIAIAIALMRHYAQRAAAGDPPPLTLIFVACADEETQSAGMLAAMSWLAQHRRAARQRYMGLINVDYVTARYPDDPARLIYLGSVGKLLPLCYCVGAATHAGDPFGGLDANLIAAELVRDLSLLPDLADQAHGEQLAPPVVLHQGDLKTVYNTQTAHEAWLYLNVLTVRQTPAVVLRKVVRRAERALEIAVDRVVRRYRAAQGDLHAVLPAHLSGARVWTYAALHAATVERHGREVVQQALTAARAACSPTEDHRAATLALIRTLWQLYGGHGPAVVVSFAPPFYPHVVSPEGPFTSAVRSVAARYAGAGVTTATYFPLLSDMSYARLEPGLKLDDLIANFPLWEDDPAAAGPRYSLPLAALRAARIEGVANIGPYGMGAHQRGERVYMPYSFAIVPQMILGVIEEVGAQLDRPSTP